MELVIPMQDLSVESDLPLRLEHAEIVDASTVDQSRREDWPAADLALRIQPFVDEPHRRTLDRVLTVFKLFKDQAAFADRVYAGEEVDVLPHYQRMTFLPRPFVLERDEVDQFNRFWSSTLQLDPSLFPVYRFHLTDYEPYYIDKVANLVSCLEYLLVPDSGGGEISYKFRVRGATVLGGSTIQSKRETFEALKNAYGLRSAIVHGNDREFRKITGGEIKSLGRQWIDVVQPIRLLARDAINYFHSKGCLEDPEARRILLEEVSIFGAPS